MPSTVEVAAGSHAGNRFEQGRDLYNYRCYFCHGYAGDAKTLATSYLKPPPRAFTATRLQDLPRQRMLASVTKGRPGTAMKGFKDILTADEIEAVVDYIRQAYMSGTAAQTRYHTAGNGWPNHERYAAAFPFATGEIALDTPPETLTAEQRHGREMFMGSCITCHDRARVEDEGLVWDARPTSFPRGAYSHRQPDAVSGATPYRQHDAAPKILDLTSQQKQGEILFQANCAFCHAADGTGKNWIGSFLEPHARDLTDSQAMAGKDAARLKQVIREGIPGTTMSAWRHVLKEQEIDAIVSYVQRAFIKQTKK